MTQIQSGRTRRRWLARRTHENKDLQELLRLARRARFGRVAFTHVRREHNELADRLVNEALDAALGAQ
jgi:ribonuclease HI